MTTATAPAWVPAVPAAPRRPGMAETLLSEFTKIRSVRSTYWTLAAQAVASIGWAVLYCTATVAHWNQRSAGFNAARASLIGQVWLGELIIAVLGALVITSEYSTGMIRTSLAVMPRRGVLYAAKALVFAAVSVVVGLVTSFAAFFTGQAILAGKHASLPLGQPGVLRAVLLSAAVVTVFGMLAYGIGAVIRHTAGAITASLGLTFLVPVLAEALPTSWYHEIMRWLPGGEALESVPSSAPPSLHLLFPAWGEFAVFSGYAAALLAIGGWLFTRRDA
jgi:ABC-2 type transport system permease protein